MIVNSQALAQESSQGLLQEYEIRPGQYIKLTAEEAARRGLTKMRGQSTARNKMQLPSGNKDR